jgi:hypothetical protein
MASVIWTMKSGGLGVLEFDAVPNESHVVSATVTEHPVEEGANMSDHAKPNLRVVTLEGVITNTPLNETTTQGARYIPGAILGGKLGFTLKTERSKRVGYAKVEGGQTGYMLPQFVGAVVGTNALKLPGQKRPHTPVKVTAAGRTTEDVTVGGSSFQATVQVDRVKACYDVLAALCLTGTEVTLVTNLKEYDTMLITSITAPVRAEDAIRFQIEFKEVRFTETKTVDITKKAPREKRAKDEVNIGSLSSYKGPEVKAKTILLQGIAAGNDAGGEYGLW